MKGRASAPGTSQERLGTEFLVHSRVLTRSAAQSARVCFCVMIPLPCLFSATKERRDTPSRTSPCHLVQRLPLETHPALPPPTPPFPRWLQLRQLAQHGTRWPVRYSRLLCVHLLSHAMCNTLCMCGLEFYTPGKGWRQAHMQGRWAILRLMIECGAVEILVRSGIWIHCPQHSVTTWAV